MKIDLLFFGSYKQGSACLINMLEGKFSSIINIVGVVTSNSRRYPNDHNEVLKIASNLKKPFFLGNVNTDSFRKWYLKLKPKIVVICKFNQIIKEETLNIFPVLSVNIHPSDLPKYRGGAPIEYTLLNQDYLRVTLHQLTKRVDSGPIIIKSSKINITNLPVDFVKDYIVPSACSLVLDRFIQHYLDSKIILKSQSGIESFAWGKSLIKEKVVDFKYESAHRIYQKILAFPDITLTVTFKDNLYTLKALKAFYFKYHNKDIPGSISYLGKEKININCIDGQLTLYDFKILTTTPIK